MEHIGNIWKIGEIYGTYETYGKYQTQGKCMEHIGYMANIKRLWDTYQNLWEIWDFPYMDVSLNGGFIVENPVKMDAN